MIPIVDHGSMYEYWHWLIHSAPSERREAFLGFFIQLPTWIWLMVGIITFVLIAETFENWIKDRE